MAQRLAYEGTVPVRLAGRWVRFPSWPGLSHHAYEAEYSKLSQYPGPGGAALFDLMLDSTTVPYQGGSCGLLLAQLRAQVEPGSRAVPGKLDGRPVLSFTIAHVFGALSTQRYQITVSRGTPARVLRHRQRRAVPGLPGHDRADQRAACRRGDPGAARRGIPPSDYRSTFKRLSSAVARDRPIAQLNT